MGKKVWEVSHEPFACSARYKYKPHAESGTERVCIRPWSLPLPPLLTSQRFDGFNLKRSSGLFFLKGRGLYAESGQSPAPVDPTSL